MPISRPLALLFLALSAWVSPLSANTPSGKQGPLIMVNTTIGLPDQGYPITTTAAIGTPAFLGTGNGYALSGESQRIAAPAGIAIGLYYNYDPRYPLDGSSFLSWAEAFFAARQPTVTNAIRAYVTANKLAGGIYTHQQNIYIQG